MVDRAKLLEIEFEERDGLPMDAIKAFLEIRPCIYAKKYGKLPAR